MNQAIDETNRRRRKQVAYNKGTTSRQCRSSSPGHGTRENRRSGLRDRAVDDATLDAATGNIKNEQQTRAEMLRQLENAICAKPPKSLNSKKPPSSAIDSLAETKGPRGVFSAEPPAPAEPATRPMRASIHPAGKGAAPNDAAMLERDDGGTKKHNS